ncbi:MAG: 50S ribosomal protein L23 [Chloroflexota bacterium]|jgi:large subunit ribosomal protein L23
MEIYDVLRHPHVTEKASHQNIKLHQYVFRVAQDATKGMIKDAIEKLFEVTVVRVNVANMPAKSSRRGIRNRRLMIRRGSYKKAIVTLMPGQTIQAFEGVK